MRRHLLLRRQWWLAALAAAGVALTHALSYQLAQADHALRHELLHDTGHDLWPPVIAPALLAALVLGAAGALTRNDSGAASVRVTAAKLSALQGAGWLAVETLERVTTGDNQLSLRSLLPVAVGVTVQFVVALLAAVLLALLDRIADAWRGRKRRATWPRLVAVWRPTFLSAPNIRVVAASWSPRGPPCR